MVMTLVCDTCLPMLTHENLVSGGLSNGFKAAKKENPVVGDIADILLLTVIICLFLLESSLIFNRH